MLVALAILTVKATVLLAGAAVAAWCLRHSSAEVRHLVWTAAFGGIVVLAATAPVAPPEMLRVDVPVPDRAAPIVDAVRPKAAVAQGAGNVPVRTFTPADALLAAWAAGASLLVARRIAGVLSLRGLTRRSKVVGTRAGVRLIETDEIGVPATWGVLRPVVALPAAARSWPAARREAALVHELAHVRRLDVLTSGIADACRALLWFHPGVWLAARRMRLECERACDDAVIGSGTDRVGYAEILVSLAEGVSRASRLRGPLAAAGGVRELETRLRSILDTAARRTTPRALVAAVPVLVAALTVGLAGLQLRASHTDATEGEAIPMSAEKERAAAAREFAPRDSREARAIARLQNATHHVKEHEADLVRERALWALSIAERDQVIAPLLAKLSGSDGRERAYAAWCLRVADEPEGLEVVARHLDDPAWRVRAEAAYAVFDSGDPYFAPKMRKLLSDPAWQVRHVAVDYLGRVGSADDLAVVRERLNDPHVAVREAAAAALAGR
jgi:beta-lactamase regulating signal transducer with metallopeptidase domain